MKRIHSSTSEKALGASMRSLVVEHWSLMRESFRLGVNAKPLDIEPTGVIAEVPSPRQ